MKSWQVLRNAIDRVGVKAVAAKLNLSSALVYKWCQEPPADEPSGSGARNPLDRLLVVYQLTGDTEIVNWVCNAARGFFVENPRVEPGRSEEQFLGSTQRMVQDFGDMLSAVSRSIENDGIITKAEAESIRREWEQLKAQAERFVIACERGIYLGRKSV